MDLIKQIHNQITMVVSDKLHLKQMPYILRNELNYFQNAISNLEAVNQLKDDDTQNFLENQLNKISRQIAEIHKEISQIQLKPKKKLILDTINRIRFFKEIKQTQDKKFSGFFINLNANASSSNDRVKAVFKKIIFQNEYISVNVNFNCLFSKIERLFFLYKQENFQTLMFQDYGMVTFQKYANYHEYSQNSQKFTSFQQQLDIDLLQDEFNYQVNKNQTISEFSQKLNQQSENLKEYLNEQGEQQQDIAEIQLNLAQQKQIESQSNMSQNQQIYQQSNLELLQQIELQTKLADQKQIEIQLNYVQDCGLQESIKNYQLNEFCQGFDQQLKSLSEQTQNLAEQQQKFIENPQIQSEISQFNILKTSILIQQPQDTCNLIQQTQWQDYLKPIFNHRKEFINFDISYIIQQNAFNNSQFNKNPQIKQKINKILCKLSHFMLFGISKKFKVIENELQTYLEDFIQNFSHIQRNNNFILNYNQQKNYAGILHYAVQEIEKNKQHKVAAYLYLKLLSQSECQGKRGKWWQQLIILSKQNLQKFYSIQHYTRHRLAIIYRLHLKNHKDSLKLCEIAVNDPSLKSGIKLRLQMYLKLLQNKSTLKNEQILQINKYDQEDSQQNLNLSQEEMKSNEYFSEQYVRTDCLEKLMKNQIKNVYFAENGQTSQVEQIALQFYKEQQWDGLHSENTMLPTLYGLFMWQEIFHDQIPFVFQNPYQRGPLDLYSSQFYENRKQIIDSKLNQLKESNQDDLKQYFAKQYRMFKYRANHFISWENITEEFISDIASYIGGPALSEIFYLFATNLRSWRSGMPDLFLWNHQKKIVKFVEVKSENDRLSAQQICWIQQITKNKLFYELCHITTYKGIQI